MGRGVPQGLAAGARVKDWSFKEKVGQEWSVLGAPRVARKPLKATGMRAELRAELYRGNLYSRKPVEDLSLCEALSSATMTVAQNHTNLLPLPGPQPLG